MATYHTVCKVSDIAEGGSKMVIVGDVQVGIFHVDGEFFALDNRCPHAGASLAHGTIDGKTVSCRIHHWQFDVQNGTRLDETCPNTNARCFPVRISGDDVQVNLSG